MVQIWTAASPELRQILEQRLTHIENMIGRHANRLGESRVTSIRTFLAVPLGVNIWVETVEESGAENVGTVIRVWLIKRRKR
jgi:hypothetical protein